MLTVAEAVELLRRAAEHAGAVERSFTEWSVKWSFDNGGSSEDFVRAIERLCEPLAS